MKSRVAPWVVAEPPGWWHSMQADLSVAYTLLKVPEAGVGSAILPHLAKVIASAAVANGKRTLKCLICILPISIGRVAYVKHIGMRLMTVRDSAQAMQILIICQT